MKYNAWELVIVIFSVTICMILLMNVIGIFLMKIPTNPDNKELRLKMADLLNTIASSVLTIVAMKFKDQINNKS